MRQIITRYDGECRKCGADLAVGATVVYEKRVGIFCPGCQPTETEDIRAYRQEAGDRRADRYQGWAEKRQEKARAVLKHDERYTGDIAFNTQPGYFPLRARVIARDRRAYESLEKARGFEEKAERLRHVVVAGDKERARQAEREQVLTWLTVGQIVQTGLYGACRVVKINRKTASVLPPNANRALARPSLRAKFVVDLSWLTIVTAAPAAKDTDNG